MHVALIHPHFSIGPGKADRPPLPDRGALLRVDGCGICGSDLDKLVHRKAAPGSVLGHEVVGRIETLADGAPGGWSVGDRVVASHHVPCLRCHYCRNDNEPMCREFKRSNLAPGGFAQYVALSEGHLRHTTFAIPDSVDDVSASGVEPLACVLRAIRRGRPPGESRISEPPSVLIAGLGFIGLLAAQAYRQQGADVYGVDIDPERLRWAREQGFVRQALHPLNERDLLQQALQTATTPGQVDIVFLSAVNDASLKMAMETVREGGVIVLFAGASQGVSIDAASLYFREISVISSYSPALRDLRDAANRIFRKEIDIQSLVSHRMPLSRIEEAFELYRTGQARKVFIDMNDLSS